MGPIVSTLTQTHENPHLLGCILPGFGSSHGLAWVCVGRVGYHGFDWYG